MHIGRCLAPLDVRRCNSICWQGAGQSRALLAKKLVVTAARLWLRASRRDKPLHN